MHRVSFSEVVGVGGRCGLEGVKSKKHFGVEMGREKEEKKEYLFHVKIVKNSRGGNVNAMKCGSEYSLERLLGGKQRIFGLSEQRNYLNYRSLGDKNYTKPEYSPEFFKKSTVFSDSYNPAKKFDRRSIKQQLGPVDGIYSKIMKIQSERTLNLKQKYYKSTN